jgi:hypothetical protein
MHVTVNISEFVSQPREQQGTLTGKSHKRCTYHRFDPR